MKKSIKVNSILAAMIFIMLFTACESVDDAAVQANGTPAEQTVSDTASEANSDTNSAEAAAEASAADITSAIMAEIEIQSAVEKTIDDIGAFYDVDTETVTDLSVFICGSGAYPDELAVFRFTDSGSAKTGAEAVRKRLENQLALYKDYTPDEVYKLEDAALIEKGEWVIFTACSDNSRAKEIAESLI